MPRLYIFHTVFPVFLRCRGQSRQIQTAFLPSIIAETLFQINAPGKIRPSPLNQIWMHTTKLDSTMQGLYTVFLRDFFLCIRYNECGNVPRIGGSPP